MSRVYLGLGSNVDSHIHITAALDALSFHFGHLDISPVYESESVGFAGSHFLNLVVGIQTTHPVAELVRELKKIEDDNGRSRSGPKFSPRTLDIDILTYRDYIGCHDGVHLPRDEVTQNAFVLLPLSELAPIDEHPELGVSYAELWLNYDNSTQKLWQVSFVWRDKELSPAIDKNH